MRSHYDDFAASETKKMSTTTTRYNSHAASDSYDNGAIPYHARENSLPFSYGQIDKTSTPLRPTTTKSSATSSSSSAAQAVSRSYKNGVERDFDFDFDFGLDTLRSNGAGYGKASNGGDGFGSYGKDVNFNLTPSDRVNQKGYNDHNSCTQTLRYTSNSGSGGGGGGSKTTSDATDASMIKSQPRLTSPLLVRKTLGHNGNASRSPTRSSINNYNNNNNSSNNNHTNTIANTYHYSLGGPAANRQRNHSSDDLFDKFGINGNINNGSDWHAPPVPKQPTTYGGGSGSGGDTLTKTPARHDFDELLRESREKVFSEYRSTTQEPLTPKGSPLPPPRRFANGSVQLPSTLPPSLRQNGSSAGSSLAPQVLSRNQGSKYNYDFQFNLNLEDREDMVDGEIARRRSHTMDRSPQRHARFAPDQKSATQQNLYQTRDIPLASSYVERNCHTISSSSPNKYYSSSSSNSNSNSNSNNHFEDRETLSPTSMLDIYAVPYDERQSSRQVSVQTTQTLQNGGPAVGIGGLYGRRSDHSAVYGNSNVSVSQESAAVPAANIGRAMTDRDSSPIYATSTKKVTTTYRSSNAAQQPSATPSAATSTTTLHAVDYPSPTSGQRPETPAFPVTPRSAFGGSIVNGHSSTSTLNRSNGYLYQQQQQQSSPLPQHALAEVQNYSTETIYGSNYRPRLNSSLSMANSEPQEVAAHLVKFAKDSSKFWYKPNLSRDEAISLLLNAAPGTFVVRDSTTYKKAYGLVLRVAQPPPGAPSTGKPDELVRHFLIEPTTRGVRLKGCANEPVFTSLSALVYEHSINQLALPCLLHIPDSDLVPPLVQPTPAQKQLLTQGAACNVLWLYSCDTESLTGEEAIRKAMRQLNERKDSLDPTEVHFKVTQHGITLTDNTRKKFFRKHYTADVISFCAIDPDHRLWTMQERGSDNTTIVGSLKKTIFAFVARRSASSKDNQCHIFCDLAITQPASAIVSFVNKTLPTERQKNYVL